MGTGTIPFLNTFQGRLTSGIENKTTYLCNQDPINSMKQSSRSAPRWRRIVFALTRKWGLMSALTAKE
ncbi:hypothetical protein HZ326_18202 [Fusarium oxysporum f. sp. albedinis]|nr:hypothetical protein HZ326_18202 [Fusarium oxysporum f. sp. albedinis]